ncbi:MAG TPA: lipoyl synthase, partial [Pseudonocardiaceae bacterium]|nr:lipoyl synthase [Pseudonocardiaceae bacterium]
VRRWVKPEEFVEHARIGTLMGFAGVMAGPLVRSSYRAGRLYAQAIAHRGDQIPEHLAHLATAGPAAQEASNLLARR